MTGRHPWQETVAVLYIAGLPQRKVNPYCAVHPLVWAASLRTISTDSATAQKPTALLHGCRCL